MTLKERLEEIWRDKPCLCPSHRTVWHLWFGPGWPAVLSNGDCLRYQKGRKIYLFDFARYLKTIYKK